jgi:excinuclease ABC subunit A
MPRNTMIAMTGLSGSGKSSLAFDTVFAEGQRRFVESLSSYARQFLKQMQKPDVDEITGLSPAISIDQKSRSNNPRSTVATITEIYDYLRVLYARVGTPYCLECGRVITKLSNEEIRDTIVRTIEEHNMADKRKSVMGVAYSDAVIRLYAPAVIGRKGEYYQLLYDMLNKGYERVQIDGEAMSLRERIELDKNKQHDIDVLVDEIFVSELDEDPDDTHERLNEAIERSLQEADGVMKVQYPDGSERIVSARFMCPYDGFAYPEIEPRLFSFNSPYGACQTCNGLGTKYFWSSEPCPSCNGARLRPESLHIYLRDSETGAEYNVRQVTELSIERAKEFFDRLHLSEQEAEISRVVLREITERLQFMINVGIEYLTLDRRANTISGGEAQRIRLASQLGSGLVGSLYVLDEPTIGLHQRDNHRLIETLKSLRDLGNTVIVVEHDEDTIFSSDYLVDLGPGAGVHGGNLVVAGYLTELLTAPDNDSGSRTLSYLRDEERIPLPERRRDDPKGAIKVRGGHVNNIKNMDVDVPLGRLNVITGVSGSGKSSLMYEILHRNLRARLDRRHRSAAVYNAASVSGTEYLGREVLIDQSPIGRTPRSNPATYTGAFTHIRDLFAATPEAQARGWKPGRFSFNVKGGRCEACQGNGQIAVEMHFLPTVYVTCDVCKGRRFMQETLEVTYRDKNIYEVLKMTVEEALSFFEDIPAIYDRLKTLYDVGLGYLELGQSATSLSGGEAQRVKIASELFRPNTYKTMYLLDEPTIGLHYDDVRRLIGILQELVRRGNTVCVIEHNMDIIKCADYVIDVGPEGGEHGGRLVAAGAPEDIAQQDASYTGQYLRRYLPAVPETVKSGSTKKRRRQRKR